MTRRLAAVLFTMVLAGCSTPPAVPVRTTSDQQLFGPTGMRLHPVFTKVADFNGDGQMDGVEAVLELQDQFGDPTKASGRILFDIYQFKAYNADPRGMHLAGPFEGRLDSMQDQRARWNRVNRAYIFQLAYPDAKLSGDYVITAAFERTDGGRFFNQLSLEGEHPRPGPSGPPPMTGTPSTQSSGSSEGAIQTVPTNSRVTNPRPTDTSTPPTAAATPATSTPHEPPPRPDQP